MQSNTNAIAEAIVIDGRRNASSMVPTGERAYGVVQETGAGQSVSHEGAGDVKECLDARDFYEVRHDVNRNARTAQRRSADIKVTIKCALGEVCAGIVENLSENGCKISFSEGENLKIDSVLGFRLADLEFITGRVVWTATRTAGIEFFAPLHPTVIEHQLKRHLLERMEGVELSNDRIDELPPLKYLRD